MDQSDAEARDVVALIVALRRRLQGEQDVVSCAQIAARFMCDAFAGSSAAINMMDYDHGMYRTIVNVGHLVDGLQSVPDSELHAFSKYPFSTQRLLFGEAYRASLDDPDCPLEYQQLLRAEGHRSCMGAPVRVQGRPLGELWVARDDGEAFSREDADLAVACGATLARRIQQLKHAAA